MQQTIDRALFPTRTPDQGGEVGLRQAAAPICTPLHVQLCSAAVPACATQHTSAAHPSMPAWGRTTLPMEVLPCFDFTACLGPHVAHRYAAEPCLCTWLEPAQTGLPAALLSSPAQMHTSGGGIPGVTNLQLLCTC